MRAANIIFLFLLISGGVFAQKLGNSPYSQIGLGDIAPTSFIHQTGLGGAGAGFSMPYFINNINPAFLSRNRNTVFEAGVSTKLTLLEEGNRNQRDFGGSLEYLTLAFPVAKRLSASFGLSPYSGVNFENSFTQKVNNSDFLANVTYRGRGGLTNVFFSGGYDLLKTKSLRPDTLRHRLSLGLKIRYIFGAVIDEAITQLFTNSVDDYQIAYYKRTSYSDFTFEPALAYSFKLKGKTKLNVGLVYNLAQDLNAKRFLSLERRNNDISFETDTLLDNQRGSVTLPSKLTLGVSIEKELKWAIAADVSFQNWTNFKDFEALDTLGKSFSASLGGQFIPEFTSISKGFWRRTMYRAGINYTQTALSFRGQTINDISVSMGASIPFSRGNTILNMAFVAGNRGTLNEGLIKERYYRFHFGVTINDLWFVKRKFD